MPQSENAKTSHFSYKANADIPVNSLWKTIVKDDFKIFSKDGYCQLNLKKIGGHCHSSLAPECDCQCRDKPLVDAIRSQNWMPDENVSNPEAPKTTWRAFFISPYLYFRDYGDDVGEGPIQ